MCMMIPNKYGPQSCSDPRRQTKQLQELQGSPITTFVLFNYKYISSINPDSSVKGHI